MSSFCAVRLRSSSPASPIAASIEDISFSNPLAHGPDSTRGIIELESKPPAYRRRVRLTIVAPSATTASASVAASAMGAAAATPSAESAEVRPTAPETVPVRVPDMAELAELTADSPLTASPLPVATACVEFPTFTIAREVLHR